jgi:dihydroorotate dehydrogenase
MGFGERFLYQAAYNAWLSRLDPEQAHGLALDFIEKLGGKVPAAPEADWRLEVRALGLRFPNPLGLAAGVDKDARAVRGWARLGFGFVEVGTVTPRPQPGNPRPRLFRLREDRALINRLGFPSDGAPAVRTRLRALPALDVPIGVNVGKNADTPLDRALDDYVEALNILAGSADFAVINISSPNTTGLRDLHQPAALTDLLRAVHPVADRAGRAGGRLPLLVKIAPDLTDSQLADVVDVVRAHEVEGVIATNSTVARPSGLHGPAATETGGLTGVPLRSLATQMVRDLRSALGPGPVIMGVGGVEDAASAFEKLQAGADLVQVYTAFVYEGPGLAGRINRGLAELLAANGLLSVSHLRGAVGV